LGLEQVLEDVDDPAVDPVIQEGVLFDVDTFDVNRFNVVFGDAQGGGEVLGQIIMDRPVGDDAALEVQGDVTAIGEKDDQEQEKDDCFAVRVPENFECFLIGLFFHLFNPDDPMHNDRS